MISHLRQDARMKLTTLSKKIGIPISTAFARLKMLQAAGFVHLTALLDFEKLGFTSRVLIALKIDRDIRDEVEQFLIKHWNINTVQRVNNGYTFRTRSE